MTGYSSGLRDKRVEIYNREASTVGKYGRDSGGVTFALAATAWASVSWAKGMRAMNQGALDSYGVVLVRMNWNSVVSSRSRIKYDGDTYQILPETFHEDKRANTIQFTAQVIVNEK